MLGSNSLFYFLLCVTFQQRRGFAIGEMKNQRVVVPWLIRNLPIASWRKHANGTSPKIKSVAFEVLHQRNPLLLCLLQQCGELCTGWNDPHPQLSRTKIFENSVHPADVVRVSVGDRDHVEVRKASRPEIGRDHVFAEIQFRTLSSDRT